MLLSAWRAVSNTTALSPMKGRILRVSGQHTLARVDGEDIRCELRGRLKAGRRATTSPVVAGDWVEVSEAGEGKMVVERVLPRTSRIARIASGPRPIEQILAANVDRFVVVVAAREPALNTGFIDRALVMALSGDITPLVCINKIDLDPESETADICELYRHLDYEVICSSVKSGVGMEELDRVLHSGVCALVGPSGAGKSSILNRLQPGLQLATQELMRQHDRGRHTTTAVQLHPLSGGGFVVDTPGLKQLQLSGIVPHQLVECFPEFLATDPSECHFRDCTHLHEPGCQIRHAVEEGRIAPSRYEGYSRIMAELQADRQERE